MTTPFALKATLDELEKRLVAVALHEHKWNTTHTARALEISRQGLLNKIKRFGFTRESVEGMMVGK